MPELKFLHDLSTPPKNIYLSIPWNKEIFKDCVAVVGSRRMTNYGQQAVEKIIPKLIYAGQTVVSGFMYGVDQYAHQVCVENGGQTVAVLGWGISSKLTGSDLNLAKKIIASGGVFLSEWEVQKPTLWTFPLRNRIVAALCKEVIVVEAAEGSGSLITARIALKLGRKVWAVPGPITSRTSFGTNKLIAEGKVQMWLGESMPAKSVQVGEKEDDDPILQILDNESLTADEISRKLGLPVAEVGAKLSILLLSGQILEKRGKYYITNAG